MIIDYTTLRNLKKVLTFDFKVRIFFLIFLLIFVAMVEMLVLALIPFYVALLINPKQNLEILNIDVSGLISNIFPGSIIIGFSI